MARTKKKRGGKGKKKKKDIETVSEVDWVRTVLSYLMSFAFIGVAIWMVYSPEFLGLGSDGPETLDEMAEEELLKGQEEVPDVELIDFECDPDDIVCQQLLEDEEEQYQPETEEEIFDDNKEGGIPEGEVEDVDFDEIIPEGKKSRTGGG